MSQRRQDYPISQADFEVWLSSPITKQFFEDIEVLPILKAQEICARSADVAGLAAAKLNGVQDTCEFFLDWMPDSLEGVDDD